MTTTLNTETGAGAIAARILAGGAGGLLIGCATWANIVKSGGWYDNPQAPAMAALAAGLAVGAGVVGYMGTRRKVLAGLTVLGLLAGEGFALMMTSERTIEVRDAKQAPIRAAHAARQDATARIAYLETAAAGLVTTPRLAQTVQALAELEAKAITTSAEKFCKVECRNQLTASTEAARAAVQAARDDLAAQQLAARERVAQARAALAAMPVMASASPLADRLGVAPWLVDITAAVLFSVAANGLGAFLVAFAAHTLPPVTPPGIRIAAPANDVVLDPGPGTPSESSDDPVVNWVRAYQARRGRAPAIKEVQAAHGISRTTAWRRIKAA